MADEPDNLVLQILRRIETRMTTVESKVDRIGEDLHGLKVRVTHVEEGLAGVNRRLDRIDERVERIEKRLDLVDHPYGGVRE
jgi:archaellum component FlaC